jgi:hypothetical protein
MNATVSFLTRKYGSGIWASQYNRGRSTVQPLFCCVRSQKHLFTTDYDTSNESPEEAQIRKDQSNKEETGRGDRRRFSQHNISRESWKELRKLMGEPLQKPAGALVGPDIYPNDDDNVENDDGKQFFSPSHAYIPEVSLYEGEGRVKKRILVLCTGGTLTMAPDPNQGGALAPVEGAISKYMKNMDELNSPDLPFEYYLHEYYPFRDSSDLGPADWATLAHDIKVRKSSVCDVER